MEWARKTRYVLGIDPGLTGAIALVNSDGTICALEDIPTKASSRKGKRVIDAKAFLDLIDILQKISCARKVIAVIEQASAAPGQGASSTFRYGEVYGALCMAIHSSGIDLETVNAGAWKRRYGLKGGDKEAARARGIKLFPQYAHGGGFNRKKDHNRAEAALIALDYIREQAR